MGKFEMGNYWTQRIENDFDLSTIGYKGLGVKYNNWLYHKRAKVVNNVIRNYLNIDDNLKIIELGVGDGFFVNLWKQKGVKNLIGIDITEQSVSTLSQIYPEYNFRMCDISSQNFCINTKFDVVSSFDILFHIVDDEKFEMAIKNISNLLSKNSVLLITDVIYDDLKYVGSQEEHFKTRSYKYYNTVLNK